MSPFTFNAVSRRPNEEHSRKSKSGSRRIRRRARLAFVPCIEPLETRVVLSSTNPFSAAWDGIVRPAQAHDHSEHDHPPLPDHVPDHVEWARGLGWKVSEDLFLVPTDEDLAANEPAGSSPLAGAAEAGTGGPTAAGGSPSGQAPFGANQNDPSEFMLGDVWATVVLLESDGSIDAQTENWTATQINQIKNEVLEGLTWWEDTLAVQFPSAPHELAFTVDFTYTDTPVATGYEPINRTTSDQALWIDDFLDHVGYNTASNIWTDLDQWNHDQRIANNADWAYTVFIVNSAADSDGYFAGQSGFAYAYLGGPFTVMTYDNDNWGISRMGQVLAHETGHIFYALDEYPNSGDYTDTSGYYNIQNLNASDGHPDPGSRVASIMAEASSQNSAYPANTSSPSSLQMLGWRDLDGDGVFDVLDVELSLTGSGSYNQAAAEYTFNGSSNVNTLNNLNPYGWKHDITINTVDTLQYRIDGGSWTAGSTYGQYSTSVSETISTAGLADGSHTIDIRTIDDETGVSSNVFNDSFQVGPPPSTPTVSISATDASADETGPDTGTFTVTRDTTAGNLTVLYVISGSATNGTDYNSLSGSVDILDGSTTATIVITPIDDGDVEGSEDVTLTITDTVDYDLGSPTSDTVTIADNDTPPSNVDDRATGESTSQGTITSGSFTSTYAGDDVYEGITEVLYAGNKRSRLEHEWTFNVTGGSSVTFFVEAHHNSSVEDFAFEYSADGGSSWTPMLTVTKTADDDLPQTFVLPASTAGNVLVRVLDTDRSRNENSTDTIFIDDMFIRSVTGGGGQPTVMVTATDADAAELGLDPGTFTVTRAGSTSGDLSVSYTVGGSATGGSDYAALSGTVVILDGDSSAEVVVTPFDDALDEGSETVVLTLSTGAGYTVGSPSSDTVSIADDDGSATDDRATGESTSQGAVTGGSFLDTQASDNVYEAITEENYQANRRSRLEHQWTFDVTGGAPVTFYVEAFHNSTVEDFVFEYSTDGVNWITMFTVTKTADDDQAQSYVLPTTTSGTVYVRVTDTDRSNKEGTTDTIFIDDMYIRSGAPAPTASLPSIVFDADDDYERAADEAFRDW